jgi:hypothetical protein
MVAAGLPVSSFAPGGEQWVSGSDLIAALIAVRDARGRSTEFNAEKFAAIIHKVHARTR